MPAPNNVLSVTAVQVGGGGSVPEPVPGSVGSGSGSGQAVRDRVAIAIIANTIIPKNSFLVFMLCSLFVIFCLWADVSY